MTKIAKATGLRRRKEITMAIPGVATEQGKAIDRGVSGIR
jgi:hypothetical protein